MSTRAGGDWERVETAQIWARRGGFDTKLFPIVKFFFRALHLSSFLHAGVFLHAASCGTLGFCPNCNFFLQVDFSEIVAFDTSWSHSALRLWGRAVSVCLAGFLDPKFHYPEKKVDSFVPDKNFFNKSLLFHRKLEISVFVFRWTLCRLTCINLSSKPLILKLWVSAFYWRFPRLKTPTHWRATGQKLT